MNEEIVALKEKAETGMVMFRDAAKQINEKGYNCHANQDGTLYVWKDVREEYGALTQPSVIVTPQQTNGSDKSVIQ